MTRLGHVLYKFAASYLPKEAQQPDIVVATGLVAIGIVVAILGAPLGAAIALAIHPDAVGLTAGALFAAGMALCLAGMTTLAVSIFVDAFRHKPQ